MFPARCMGSFRPYYLGTVRIARMSSQGMRLFVLPEPYSGMASTPQINGATPFIVCSDSVHDERAWFSLCLSNT